MRLYQSSMEPSMVPSSSWALLRSVFQKLIKDLCLGVGEMLHEGPLHSQFCDLMHGQRCISCGSKYSNMKYIPQTIIATPNM